MRWKIETKKGYRTEEEQENGKTYEKTYEDTTTSRTLYITIGDIVGAGKTAVGAVKKLSKQLPVFIDKMKGLATSSSDTIGNSVNASKDEISNSVKAEVAATTAMTINYMVQPLSVILDGVEKYRKFMNIVDRLTPVMKTIARTTGVWCSPGNVAELAQMAAGKANQLLMALLSESIVKLKDFIWNYEFDLKTISSTTSNAISKNLKKYNENNRNLPISRSIITDVTDSRTGNTSGDETDYNDKDSKIDDLIDDLFPTEFDDVKPDPYLLLEMLKGRNFGDDKKGKYNYNSNNYITEYIDPKSTFKRMLFGSLDNGGIYYSDDDGATWIQSEQKDKSFAKFCKILKPDGKYRYIAGSTYTIEEIKSMEVSEEIERDSYNRYSKDYYSLNMEKLNRKEKDFVLKNNDLNEIRTNSVFNNSKKIEKDNAFGIYYSDDNGINWKQTKITTGRFELFFEFHEKEGTPENIPDRLVASSYDYEGVYWSDNGVDWNRSNLLKGDKEEPITTGRWVFYTDNDEELPNKIISSRLKAEANVSFASASAVVNVSGKNSSTMNSKCASNINISIEGILESYNLNNLEYLKEITLPIIKYIHDNYSERLIHYSEKWWLEKIGLIISGEYTLEDAKNGKGLEGDL